MRAATTLVTVLALVRPVHADACDAHLARVAAALRADAHAGRLHAWGWALGNGAIAIGLVGVGLTVEDSGRRAEAYVGAGGALVSATLPLLFARVPAIADAPRLDREIADTSDPCALVPEADRLLARSAADERFARGLVSHAANLVINLGGWLVLGVGWHRWATSGIGAALGIAMGELEIYTRPTHALRLSLAPGGLTLAGSF